MARQKLTDKAVAAAHVRQGQRLELWDETTPGLCLRVSDSGKKVWVWRYRTLDGRQPRLTLGDYSTKHGLKWAREQVEELRVHVRRGADPAAERRQAREKAKGEPIRTFDDLADAYLSACKSGEWKPKNKQKRERTIADEKGILKRHIRPALGKERVEDVTRPMVRRLLRAMVARKIGAQTNRTQAVIRQCFAYAISEERVALNPATGFAPLASETPRVRVLSDAELKTLWEGLLDPSGLRQPSDVGEGVKVTVGRPMRIALQLTLLLLQRRAEIMGMAVSELYLDQGVWLIPAERMKNGYPHLVPLPPEAVKLIIEAIALAKSANDDKVPAFVFPSPRDHERPIRPDSMTHAMRALCGALGIADASPHDLRRTGATAMTSERLGVAPFIRSKVLAHRGDTGGGAAVSMIHYDANQYVSEKRRALEGWCDLLLNIVSGSPAAGGAEGASEVME